MTGGIKKREAVVAVLAVVGALMTAVGPIWAATTDAPYSPERMKSMCRAIQYQDQRVRDADARFGHIPQEVWSELRATADQDRLSAINNYNVRAESYTLEDLGPLPSYVNPESSTDDLDCGSGP